MMALWLGLALTAALTAVLGWGFGRSAIVPVALFGLLATAIQVAAAGLVRPVLGGPFEDLLRRWAYGMALRLGGVVVFGLAVWLWRDVFLPLPTALGFLGVLVPLLFTEIRLFR